MKNNEQHIVNKDSLLLEYLINELHINRNKAKTLLKFACVNGNPISKFNYELKKGDVLTFNSSPIKTSKGFDLDIIYEDENFIVINKPAGLLTIASESEKEKTAYHLVREYVQSKNKHDKLFILHRIDKDTSGVLAFIKNNTKLRDTLQEQWNDIVLTRKYYAIVRGRINKKEDTIVNYIHKGMGETVNISDESDKYAKKAITEYKVMKTSGKHTLLDVNILTGRKNQIRVTFNDLGYPIIGDQKYGKIKSPIKRLGLHAYELSFKNPVDNKTYTFKTAMPQEFKTIFEASN
ncbi:MAG: RluA family pseudouridine synthase [Erysipelotrichaceae bacterium]|nr:RluA family pseudouridine synthase [Erysipelotrichaceae bacterium]